MHDDHDPFQKAVFEEAIALENQRIQLNGQCM